MPYKVFISTNDDEPGLIYLNAVKEALFRFDDFPISAITLNDVAPEAAQNRWEIAKRVIEDSQIFIGIYGSYGTVPAGQTGSIPELEYRYAHDRGLTCLIFVPEALKTGGDDRFQAFHQHLATTHVIHYFKAVADLQAKVILSVGNFKKMQPPESLRPTQQSFQSGSPDETVEAARVSPLPDDFDQMVERAVQLATDDMEAIVRRALELHDAQKMVSETPDGWLNINPIFGAPMTDSQFRADIFMITPFRPQFDSIYQNVIMPVVKSLNLTIKRGDDFASVTGVIINEVWAAISACRVVIVETTEVNANVYYELGIAHTLGKPAILLTQEKEIQKLPFDIRHMRFIIYDNTIPGGEKLEEDLRKAIVWILNDLAEN